MGELPVSVEGFDTGEWILMDYGDFIVHIFSASARATTISSGFGGTPRQSISNRAVSPGTLQL